MSTPTEAAQDRALEDDRTRRGPISDKKNRNSGARLITELVAELHDAAGSIERAGTKVAQALYSPTATYLLLSSGKSRSARKCRAHTRARLSCPSTTEDDLLVAGGGQPSRRRSSDDIVSSWRMLRRADRRELQHDGVPPVTGTTKERSRRYVRENSSHARMPLARCLKAVGRPCRRARPKSWVRHLQRPHDEGSGAHRTAMNTAARASRCAVTSLHGCGRQFVAKPDLQVFWLFRRTGERLTREVFFLAYHLHGRMTLCWRWRPTNGGVRTAAVGAAAERNTTPSSR